LVGKLTLGLKKSYPEARHGPTRCGSRVALDYSRGG
jgi:hypothetical protein